jgi:D-alanine-D-alanine ligase
VRITILQAAQPDPPRCWGDDTVVADVASELTMLGHTVSVGFVADDASLTACLHASQPDFCIPNAYRVGPRRDDPFLCELLDRAGLPHFGSGLPAIQCISKAYWKPILAAAGVPTPRWQHLDEVVGAQSISLAYPLIAKPAEGAESVGIFFVGDEVERGALRSADRAASDGMIVEEYSRCREFTVTVIGNTPRVAWPIEVVLPAGSRLLSNSLKEHAIRDTVRPIGDDATLRPVEELAIAACDALGVEDWARVDIVERTDGELVVIDVNVMPGLRRTPDHPSFVPMCAHACATLDYPALIRHLLDASLARWGLGVPA